ncbi:MAG: ATP-binding protein [Rhodopirellula sp. JB044]|uniref:sensor histidine kinase n=1 Tax=Rhodopirellula sp. JB044 TaxID=3342844 RepID=UPI00370AEA78
MTDEPGPSVDPSYAAGGNPHSTHSEHRGENAELNRDTCRWDDLAGNNDIGMMCLDHELKIQRFNPAITNVFYVLPQDIGRPIEHIATSLDVANLHDEIRSVFRTDRAIELKGKNRQGRYFLIRIRPNRPTPNANANAIPIDQRTDERDPCGIVLTCVDVSSVVRGYEKIRRTAETIELTDHDLQEFAYAVSHDLQAPLRHIATNTRWLREKYHTQDDEETCESFAAINTSMARLESMFVGLLQYSRVYSLGNTIVKTDLPGLVDSAMRTLADLIEENNVEIQCGPLPALVVDPEQIATVFAQLILNSIHYRQDHAPKIRIEARQNQHSWEIDFHDNGIGIAAKHRERVFVIFSRLEFRSVPGEGMGLALCKRIIQRHGGRIFAVDSPFGRGVTMRIQMPFDFDGDVNAGELNAGEMNASGKDTPPSFEANEAAET